MQFWGAGLELWGTGWRLLLLVRQWLGDEPCNTAGRVPARRCLCQRRACQACSSTSASRGERQPRLGIWGAQQCHSPGCTPGPRRTDVNLPCGQLSRFLLVLPSGDVKNNWSPLSAEQPQADLETVIRPCLSLLFSSLNTPIYCNLPHSSSSLNLGSLLLLCSELSPISPRPSHRAVPRTGHRIPAEASPWQEGGNNVLLCLTLTLLLTHLCWVLTPHQPPERAKEAENEEIGETGHTRGVQARAVTPGWTMKLS